MLITNMIWKQLSHTNSLTIITRLLYLWILYKNTEYIDLFKQSQVFRYTLYLHDVQKLASVSYSSLSN